MGLRLKILPLVLALSGCPGGGSEASSTIAAPASQPATESAPQSPTSQVSQGQQGGSVKSSTVATTSSGSSAATSTTIKVPFDGETYKVTINAGAATTDNRAVTLTIMPPPSATKMALGETANFSATSWVIVALTASFTFSKNGTNTIYVSFQDAAGHLVTTPASSSIQVVPFTSSNGGITIVGGAPVVNSRHLSLALTVPAMATQMMLSTSSTFVGSIWQAATASAAFDVVGNGSYSLYTKFADGLGTVSPTFSTVVAVDVFPAGSISASISATTISSPSRTIRLTNIAGPSSAAQMIISSKNDFSDASWQPFATSYDLQLPALSSTCGPQFVYLKLRNSDNFESYVVSGQATIVCWDVASSYSGFNDGQNARWTGHEFIRWKGVGTDYRYYDLTTGQWVQLSTTGAPALTGEYSMYRTGNYIIFWFGWMQTNYMYSLVGQTWSTIPSLSYAEPLTEGWTGDKMVVWGGERTYSGAVHSCSFMGNLFQSYSYFQDYSEGASYNPATNSWTSLSTSGTQPSPRAAAAIYGDGSNFLLMGGYQTSTCGDINPANRTKYGGANVYNFAGTIWTNSALTKSGPALRTASGLLVCAGAGNSRLYSAGTWGPDTPDNCLQSTAADASLMAYDWENNRVILLSRAYGSTSRSAYRDMTLNTTVEISMTGAQNFSILKTYAIIGIVFVETNDHSLYVYTPF